MPKNREANRNTTSSLRPSVRETNYNWAIQPKLFLLKNPKHTDVVQAIIEELKSKLVKRRVWKAIVLKRGLLDVVRLVSTHKQAMERDKLFSKMNSIADITKSCKTFVETLKRPNSHKHDVHELLRSYPIGGAITDIPKLITALETFHFHCRRIQTREPIHKKQPRRDVDAAITSLIAIWEKVTETPFKKNFDRHDGSFLSPEMTFLEICFRHLFPADKTSKVKTAAAKALRNRSAQS